MVPQPLVVQGLNDTETHHSWWVSSGQVIDPMQTHLT
jgi:hypothetical protein